VFKSISGDKHAEGSNGRISFFSTWINIFGSTKMFDQAFNLAHVGSIRKVEFSTLLDKVVMKSFSKVFNLLLYRGNEFLVIKDVWPLNFLLSFIIFEHEEPDFKRSDYPFRLNVLLNPVLEVNFNLINNLNTINSNLAKSKVCFARHACFCIWVFGFQMIKIVDVRTNKRLKTLSKLKNNFIAFSVDSSLAWDGLIMNHIWPNLCH